MKGHQRALLYYLVALYIGYCGYSIMSNRLAGDNTMSYPLAILLTVVLLIGAVIVALYATRRMKVELKQNKIRDTGKDQD